MRPKLPDAYQLFHEGTIALAEVERNGMRVDVEYLDRAIEDTEKQLAKMKEELREDDVYRIWRREFGTKTKLNAKAQLGHVVFNVMGHDRKDFNKSNDAAAFEGLDIPFLKKYSRIQKLETCQTRYLKGVKRELEGEFLHSIFNLNLVQSYRGSSDSVNFQNFPVRDEEQAKLVRSMFIARKKHRITELDFSGIEVCTYACYNHDPVLMDYVRNSPPKDMHRDMAAKAYKIDLNSTPADYWKEKHGGGKDVRYNGKNKFVFPQFYGDYYVQCAVALWDAIELMKLRAPGGIPMREHLANMGIKERGDCKKSVKGEPNIEPRRGTFEHHLKQVEKDFWQLFKVFANWKKANYEKYLRQGYLDTLTGFRINGVYNKKQISNYPVQGSAFHCLLWCMIQLQKWLKKNKMKSKIVGQIHDSIVGDTHEDELDDYLGKAHEIMTVDLLKHWDWIIVPFKVEAEVAPPGGNWYQKKEVRIAA